MADSANIKKNLGETFRDPTMVFSIIIIITILMLILPVPTFMLDFLMSLSILSGIMILLTVSYLKSTTDFSIFPTLLLVTTIFRIAINVSSTRLILSKGPDFDGKLVRAFGSFVVGGGDNGVTGMVIGVIIFVILVIVQFIIISKGATRISEVAARFSLDGMPNKFMAIEMDQNSGAITESDAIKKREQVWAESSFYGSMDGASKFVQGDVIVGIIITIVNIVGGFIVGMGLRGEPLESAVDSYVVLTVGDGLVSQIPSLLISFASGLLVSRSQAKESIGTTLWNQLTSQHKIFYISGGAMLVMALFPGFPHLILILLGGAMIFAGTSLRKVEIVNEEKIEQSVKDKAKDEKKGPEDVSSLLKVDPLTLHIGYELIPLINNSTSSDILNAIAGIRRNLAIEYGVIVPPIRIQDNIRIDPGEYVFKIRGQEIGKGRIKAGYMMAMGDGLEAVEGEKTIEPAFGLPAYWVKEDSRAHAENLGYTVVDPPTIISTHIQELLKMHIAEILDRENTNELIENARKDYPVLVNDLLTDSKFTKNQIQKVLQNLLKEGVSIRDISTIFETLSEFNSQVSVFELTEYIRQALKRVVCSKYKTDDGHLYIIKVHPKIEQEIYKNMSLERDGEPVIRLNPDLLNRIQMSIRDKVTEMYKDGYAPVIVTQPQIRRALWDICQLINKNIAVLSTREITSDVEIVLYGQVGLEERA